MQKKEINIVCEKNNIPYKDLRIAQIKGARTLEELKKATGVCGECEVCKENLTYIMKVVCCCNMVTFDDVKNQLDNGLNTFEEISKQTKAGTTCGHCKAFVENIIKQGY